jgi:hypothetical protein
LIDWSDPDEMLRLLCEYVADEKSDAQNDHERVRFLAELNVDSVAVKEMTAAGGSVVWPDKA